MQRIISFLLETEKLKSVLRQTKPIDHERYENSAEHSWQTALAAMLLLEQAPDYIDQLKVLKMLLIHDIVEIDTGDVFVYDTAAREAVFEAESTAAKRLFGLLEAPLSKQLNSLWHEFESGETPEAKFAKAADRIMPVLQNLYSEGQSWNEHGITKDRILNRNEPIREASNELWEILKKKITDSDFLQESPEA